MLANVWTNITDWFSSGNISKWLADAGNWLIKVLPVLINCIIVIVLGYWLAGVVSRIVARALRRTKVSKEIAAFAASGTRLVLRLAAILWAISFLNINILSVLTALSALGITLGLALKDTITSLSSGFIIMDSRPFTTGDLVEINGALGRVEKIELTNTTLLTNDNKTLIIPNSVVTTTTVVNYTANPQRRMDLHFTVREDSDVEKVSELLADAVEDCTYRLPEQTKRVGIVGVENGKVTFEVRFWINANDYTPANFFMHERVQKDFAENGIKTA